MKSRSILMRFAASLLTCSALLGCFSGCDSHSQELETKKYSIFSKDSTNTGSSVSTLPTDGTPPIDPLPPVPTPPTEVTLKVWGPSEDIGEGEWLTRQMEAFEKAHPEYTISWDVGVCFEDDVGTMVTMDPEAAADVYLFASDQLGGLITAGALSRLGGSYKDQVLNDNPTTMVQSVTYTDGEIYGFPISANTWFMYYNKSMFTEDDIKSLDTMLSKGKVAMDIANGWYIGSFFFGAGGTLFGPNGLDANAGVDFKGATGTAVAQKMVQMHKDGNLMDGGYGADITLFMEGKVGAFFSGSWYYNTLKKALGDDLGVAVLPSFEVEGKTYTMKSFAGSKAVGVNAHIEEPLTQQVATKFAAFLASKDSQELRFNLRAVTPTHIDLANSDMIKYHPIASVEVQVIQSYSILQPCIPAMGKYWTPMGNFGACILNGTVTEENAGDMLQQALEQMNS